MRAGKKKSATCVTWGKIEQRAQTGKKPAMSAIWKGSQRRTRGIPKKKSATCITWGKISDGRDLWKRSQRRGAIWKRIQRRTSATRQKTATWVTWGKISNGRDLGKFQRCAHSEIKVSDRCDLWKKPAMSATWKGSQPRICATRKEVSDGLVQAGEKVSDMRNQGKNQRQARPLKKVSDGATWRWSQQWSLVIWKKVSDMHNLGKNSATGTTWKMSATGVT